MEHPLSNSKYPAWVIPHASHIERLEGRPIVTALFPEHHVDRDTKEVSVLVYDEDGENLALSERAAAPAAEQKDA